MLSVRVWRHFIVIDEVNYLELTLEVLATFTLARDRMGWSRTDQIQFQLFGELYCMKLTDFALCLGPYNLESPKLRHINS